MKAKIFKIKVDDANCYMDAISLVDFPAVEVNWLAFNEDKKVVHQKFNLDKHIITGVVCLADTPIYRYSAEIGEYYVVFEKETILKMVQKYSAMGLFNSVNIQHDNNNIVENIVLFESYIVDEERGVYAPKEFTNIPNGSWICSFKVNDEELWKDITEGRLKGFSLQGLFQLEEETVKNYFSNNKLKELSMGFNVKLRNLILRFNDVKTDKGIITIDGEMVIGAIVYVGDELAPDGEYATETEVIKVENGTITEIETKEPEDVKEDVKEEIVEEPTKEEDNELMIRIKELEGLLENRDAIIEELTEKLKEAEAKLHQSVEEFTQIKPIKKKSIYDFKTN